MSDSTTVRVDRTTWRALKRAKKLDETMDEAIARLLEETDAAEAVADD